MVNHDISDQFTMNFLEITEDAGDEQNVYVCHEVNAETQILAQDVLAAAPDMTKLTYQ